MPNDPAITGAPAASPQYVRRDLQAEQRAVAQYARSRGRLPNSSQDWREVHDMAYGQGRTYDPASQPGYRPPATPPSPEAQAELSRYRGYAEGGFTPALAARVEVNRQTPQLQEQLGIPGLERDLASARDAYNTAATGELTYEDAYRSALGRSDTTLADLDKQITDQIQRVRVAQQTNPNIYAIAAEEKQLNDLLALKQSRAGTLNQRVKTAVDQNLTRTSLLKGTYEDRASALTSALSSLKDLQGTARDEAEAALTPLLTQIRNESEALKAQGYVKDPVTGELKPTLQRLAFELTKAKFERQGYNAAQGWKLQTTTEKDTDNVVQTPYRVKPDGSIEYGAPQYVTGTDGQPVKSRRSITPLEQLGITPGSLGVQPGGEAGSGIDQGDATLESILNGG